MDDFFASIYRPFGTGLIYFQLCLFHYCLFQDHGQYEYFAVDAFVISPISQYFSRSDSNENIL